MRIRKIIFFLIALSFSSCVSVENNIWKHEAGYRIGDFIDFKKDGQHSLDYEGYIYSNNKKVARLAETNYGLAGNHKIIIECLEDSEKRGVYTIN
jgi:hypothetical protein